MKVLLNGIISENILAVNTDDRALQFGDGLFETIIVKNRDIQFFDLHFDRLTRGMKAMQLNSSLLNKTQLKNEISGLLEANTFNGTCRVKILIWRKSSEKAGYSTNCKEFNILITIKESANPTIRIIEKTGISKNVHVTPTLISKFKTISALPYVMASIERDQRKLDELIITNPDGIMAEGISSNLFWIMNDQIFTSPLTTGCVEGIIRTQLIHLFKNEGKPIIEKEINYTDLQKQEIVFTANVAGISIIKFLDEKELKTSHPILDQIKQLLAL